MAFDYFLTNCTVWGTVCAKTQKVQTIFTQTEIGHFDDGNSLLLSLFHRVSGRLTRTEQEIPFHYRASQQKRLDHLIPSLLCCYFLHHRTFPRGIHNHNGFPEILSTWPNAEGGHYRDDGPRLVCRWGKILKNVIVLCLKGFGVLYICISHRPVQK